MVGTEAMLDDPEAWVNKFSVESEGGAGETEDNYMYCEAGMGV
jgi:hypothetical protein